MDKLAKLKSTLAKRAIYEKNYSIFYNSFYITEKITKNNAKSADVRDSFCILFKFILE